MTSHAPAPGDGRQTRTAAGPVPPTIGLTGIAEIDGAQGWMHTAGWFGVALAVISGYAALALELEGSEARTVLPLGRTGDSKNAVENELHDQVATIATEPGVRQQL